MINPLPALQPGDHLLYRPSDFFGHLIAIKTWFNIAHIEVYAGNGTSFASRGNYSDNKFGLHLNGVNEYPLRIADLAYVLRPNKPFNINIGRQWFYDKAKGQGYDFKGLLCFYLAVKEGAQDRMFCSEFATRFDRMCSFNPFHPDWDADRVAPDNFLMSAPFDRVWTDGKDNK